MTSSRIIHDERRSKKKSFIFRQLASAINAESPEESLQNLLQVLNGSSSSSSRTTKSSRNQVSSGDDDDGDDGGGSSSVVLNITLQRQSSVQYQRRLIMEFEWFLGCIGGILALFTGFSLLAITQTIYKCALDSYRHRVDKKKWDSALANFDRRRANSDPGLR